jgi:hypothetical protein
VAGHLFVIHGDVTRLACDAWALPCDASLLVTGAWVTNKTSPIHDPLGRNRLVGIERPEGWGDSGRRVLQLDGHTEPQVWLINTGGTAGHPVEWYLKAIDQLLDQLRGLTSSRGRSRPLVAFPFVGSGQGGQALVRGGLLDRLLAHFQAKVSQEGGVPFDVALVLRSANAFTAAQALRRRQGALYWPSLPDGPMGEIEALATHARAGHLVLFLGAGVSAGAGLPTWKGLLNRLATTAGLMEGGIDAKLGELDRARLIERRLDARKIDLRDAIRDFIEPAKRHSLAHALLAALPSSEAVTTNYDRLFEAAVHGAGGEIAVLPYEPVTPGGRWLLKMHGSIDHRDDLVLTREDYIRYADRRGALAGIVQALLITRHMLFVGFSLSDDNFHRIADDVRKAVRRPGMAPSKPLGTALIISEHHAALKELWRGDLDCVEIGDAAGSAASRARLLEIFLDRLLASATTATAHLLDPAFRDSLTHPERTLAAALLSFSNELEEEARLTTEWATIAQLLREFGLPETQLRDSVNTKADQP